MGGVVGGKRGTGNDRGNDRLDTPQNIHRSHPHYPVPIHVQEFVTSLFAFWSTRSAMYLAIHFDDQPRAKATEIGDIGADRMLPAELEPGAISPQFLPEEYLWQRHSPSQPSSGGYLGPVHLPRSPSTAFGGPPPRSGEDLQQPRIHHLAALRQADRVADLFVEHRLARFLVPEGREEVVEVAREQRRGVRGQPRRHVAVADDLDAVLLDHLARDRALDIAAGLDRKVNDDAARAHRRDLRDQKSVG